MPTLLTPAELTARLTSGELWRLLDVRQPWEFEIANVAGTVFMPMPEVPARFAELDPAQPTAVLCHTGVRSARVAGWLLANGFATVANIEGGIDAWSREVDDSIPRY